MTKTQISFGIVLKDEILYCSNEDKYNFLEIILFVEKLIRSFNPKQTWRLNSIYLKRAKDKERLFIRHEITETNKNLFFIVSGAYEENSQEIRKMLKNFFEKVNTNYNTGELLEKSSKKPIFKEIIDNITDFLWNKYEILLEQEEIKQEVDHETTNKILYGGISSQGLPIISKLFDPTLLNNLDKKITTENIELFNSSFSAQLATIEMNTLIRTNKYKIKQIHIFDLEDKKNKKIILYDNIDKNHFSLTIFASGNFFEIKDLMKLLKFQISKEYILHKEFSGDIKTYKYLDNYFLGLDREF
ncbi:MAG: hypothetical protein EU529_03320 [Promethearchaeota archaeon]|nr:MAG: hypothetical protein EU529_03320 [Candidatus Lokiarchaeota archaeon]